MDLKNASQTLINAYHTPHPPHFQMRKLSDRIWHSHLPAALRVGAVSVTYKTHFGLLTLGSCFFLLKEHRHHILNLDNQV